MEVNDFFNEACLNTLEYIVIDGEEAIEGSENIRNALEQLDDINHFIQYKFVDPSNIPARFFNVEDEIFHKDEGNPNITKVRLQNGDVTIGEKCFTNCKNLTDIENFLYETYGEKEIVDRKENFKGCTKLPYEYKEITVIGDPGFTEGSIQTGVIGETKLANITI